MAKTKDHQNISKKDIFILNISTASSATGSAIWHSHSEQCSQMNVYLFTNLSFSIWYYMIYICFLILGFMGFYYDKWRRNVYLLSEIHTCLEMKQDNGPISVNSPTWWVDKITSYSTFQSTAASRLKIY